jgi:hypothetical protein
MNPAKTGMLMMTSLSALSSPSGCGTAPGSMVDVSESLAIGVCSVGVMRVVHTTSGYLAKQALMDRKSLMASPDFPASKPDFTVTTDPPTGDLVVTTSLMKAIVKNGTAVRFFDAISGAALTSEIASSFTPTTDPAAPQETTYKIEQSFTASTDEGLYGGGEFQNGLVGFRGVPIEMVQYNTEAAVPFFSSTKGYGILWDSNAWSYLNPPTSEPIAFSAAFGPSPTPLGDGMAVTLAPCTEAQAWRYDASSKAIFANGSSEVLDCDNCPTGKQPHLWHLDGAFQTNQQWE